MKSQVYSLGDSESDRMDLDSRRGKAQIEILKVENAEYRRKEQALRTLNTTLAQSFGSISNNRADSNLVGEIKKMLGDAINHPVQTIEQLRQYYQNIITELKKDHRQKIKIIMAKHEVDLKSLQSRIGNNYGQSERGSDVQKNTSGSELEEKDSADRSGLGRFKFMSDVSICIPKPILRDNNTRKHSKAGSIAQVVESSRVNLSSNDPRPAFRSYRNMSVATELLCNNCKVAFPPIDFFSHIQGCKKENVKPGIKKNFKKTNKDDLDNDHMCKLKKEKKEIQDRIQELRTVNRQNKKTKERTDFSKKDDLVNDKKGVKADDSVTGKKEKQLATHKTQISETSTARFPGDNCKKRASCHRIR